MTVYIEKIPQYLLNDGRFGTLSVKLMDIPVVDAPLADK